MSGILWLASYPKSGNTWLRAFLANYLANSVNPVDINSLPDFAYGDMRAEYFGRVSGKPAAQLSWAEINALRPLVHRFLANSRRTTAFVKTHTLLTTIDGVPTVTPDVTAGAIYIVRNPFDVAVSFAHHYGLTNEEGVRALCFTELRIEPKEGQIPQVISDWSSHLASWIRPPGLHRLILRFEDMLATPQSAFAAVLEFLKLPENPERLTRAISHSSFRVLAQQEHESGFLERSRNAERFFRKGEVGGFRRVLSEDQVARLIDRHEPMLRQQRYLDNQGRLLI